MELNNEELLLPQCRVFVDGRQIKASEEMIESVSVQLSASQMSNSCEVVIFCDHDHGRSTIGNIISRASAGKKIRVEMGYRLTKPVFLGYINAAGVSFSEDGVTLTLSCLDARGLLMGNTSRESFENKSVSQIVKELLEPVRGYTDGITVSVPGSRRQGVPHSEPRHGRLPVRVHACEAERLYLLHVRHEAEIREGYLLHRDGSAAVLLG